MALLKFLPHMDTKSAGRPNTDHYDYILTFFMGVNKKEDLGIHNLQNLQTVQLHSSCN